MVVAIIVVVTSLVVARPGVADADRPLRILLYGDSITQGSSGDWTWRYFVDRHLRSSGVSFDLVGPRPGVHHLPEPETGLNPDDEEYADPAFDHDSGAVWGQALSWPVYELAGPSPQALVPTYLPDVVASMIGIDDMGFLQVSPQRIVEAIGDQIQTSRLVNPDIDWVLVEYPNTWLTSVPIYNQHLRALAADLTTERSRVEVAEVPPADQSQDTFDGTHPSGSGAIRIATGVEDALASIGVGTAPTTVPVVPVGPARPPALTAYPGVGEATLLWAAAPGVYTEWVEMRDATAAAAWIRHRTPFPDGVYQAVVPGLADGHRYQFRLRPQKKNSLAEVTSAVVEVVPGARPTAPRPALDGVSAGGRVRVRWPATPATAGYRVEVTTRDGAGVRTSTPTTSPSWLRTGLRNGAVVVVRVRAENGLLASEWSLPLAVAVPSLKPVTKALSSSPRHRVVVARAATVAYATSYRLQSAAGRSCRSRPAASRFVRTGAEVTSPRARFRTRAAYVWARWSPVRDTAVGPVAGSSYSCTKVR